MSSKQDLVLCVRRLKHAVRDMLDQGESAVLYTQDPPAPAAAPPAPRPAQAPGVRTGLAAHRLSPAAGPAWTALAAEAGGCVKCALSRSRKTVVFGDGDLRAELVFVGEAPGAEEDREGLPFVGHAGQLLTKIISAIGLRRDQVYICNVLKCRPPGNRNPLPAEISACQPYLEKQLALLSPKLICALGTFAAQTLLEVADPISRLRGRTHFFRGIPVVATLHPAALLYHPQNKRLVWEDMQAAAKLLGLPVMVKGKQP